MSDRAVSSNGFDYDDYYFVFSISIQKNVRVDEHVDDRRHRHEIVDLHHHDGKILLH